MRLLVLSNLYPPNVIGGYERLCFEVTSALAERGHEISVLTSTFGGNTSEYPRQMVRRTLRLLVGSTIYSPFPGSPDERESINRENIEILDRTITDLQPQAIVVWNLFFLDRSILDGLARTRARVILILTDNWLIEMQNPSFMSDFFRDYVFGNKNFEPAINRFLPSARQPRHLLEKAVRWFRGSGNELLESMGLTVRLPFDAIFGSRFVRDLYSSSGIEFAEQRVIYNGVQQRYYAAGGRHRDRTCLIEPQTLSLLFAGRIVDLKGVETAVDALSLLNPAELGLERVRLTIVGDLRDAVYVQALLKRIERGGCAAQIVMQEQVPESELFELFQSHDIYLFPSLYEPFSLTLIHALACGIPTIASRTGGNVEIVQDKKTGILFAKGNAQELACAVRLLVRQPVLRERIAVGGQQIARSFTLERMVTELERFVAQPHEAV